MVSQTIAHYRITEKFREGGVGVVLGHVSFYKLRKRVGDAI
jgi:hypothetical protein